MPTHQGFGFVERTPGSVGHILNSGNDRHHLRHQAGTQLAQAFTNSAQGRRLDIQMFKRVRFRAVMTLPAPYLAY